jgi:hypothetical protein
MGSQAPWAFLVAGVAILATGNTMSEFSQTIPSAGSFVTFIGRGYGARAPRTGSALAGLSYYMLMICYPVAGDVACNPFDIAEAVGQIEAAAGVLLGDAGHLLAIGGDHTIAYPLLRVTRRKFGPVALVHFDAHLDTWDTYFGAPITHGTRGRGRGRPGLRPCRDDHRRRRARRLRAAGPHAARPLTPRSVRYLYAARGSGAGSGSRRRPGIVAAASVSRMDSEHATAHRQTAAATRNATR